MAEAYWTKDADDGWEPFEVGVVKWVRNDDDVKSGLWKCTTADQPDAYEGEFTGNETMLVLEGQLKVEVLDGPTVELSAGDTASFVKGTTGRWTVVDDVKTFFVYS